MVGAGVVLLDMHLGDISGLEVVRRINEVITSRKLRVTIITGLGFSMDVIKAMSLGAFEYWVKPVDPRVFEAGVRRALNGLRADPAHMLRHPSPSTLVAGSPERSPSGSVRRCKRPEHRSTTVDRATWRHRRRAG